MAYNPPNLDCRMYEARFSDVDVAVMILVKSISEMCTYITLEYNNIDDKDLFLKEKKMLKLFQQAIKAEIFQLLQHSGSCYSIWQALLNKDRGNLDMRKSKIAFLKKEVDIFTQVKGESFAQLVERYFYLVNEMKRLKIDKP
ncbi:eukaryotic translation initiation factor 2 subunit alpha-like [Bidens hawaiensis]|uniref:eukaryotic translation initiation factor 2 subunit alpha-like n=1 Tax=Bidens hawaiensis TaxID=980011 RepID=UPI004049FDBB